MLAIYRNLQSKCIEIIQFAFMCTICTRVQICSRVQINLHHLEGRSKFAPGYKFLKHRSHGQKYTPGANLPPGANLHPGANCAHERGLRFIEKVSIEAQNLHVKDQTVTLPIKLKIARMKETRKNHQKRELKHYMPFSSFADFLWTFE